MSLVTGVKGPFGLSVQGNVLTDVCKAAASNKLHMFHTPSLCHILEWASQKTTVSIFSCISSTFKEKKLHQCQVKDQ